MVRDLTILKKMFDEKHEEMKEDYKIKIENMNKEHQEKLRKLRKLMANNKSSFIPNNSEEGFILYVEEEQKDWHCVYFSFFYLKHKSRYNIKITNNLLRFRSFTENLNNIKDLFNKIASYYRNI